MTASPTGGVYITRLRLARIVPGSRRIVMGCPLIREQSCWARREQTGSLASPWKPSSRASAWRLASRTSGGAASSGRSALRKSASSVVTMFSISEEQRASIRGRVRTRMPGLGSLAARRSSSATAARAAKAALSTAGVSRKAAGGRSGSSLYGSSGFQPLAGFLAMPHPIPAPSTCQSRYVDLED